jgi:hypothetical protein
LWAGRRSWLPGRADRTRTSISGTGIEELGAFFGGGKRPELAQRNGRSWLTAGLPRAMIAPLVFATRVGDRVGIRLAFGRRRASG